MPFLLDTNVLIRFVNSTDASHRVATDAITTLHRRGEVLHITPQNLIEFRNVATRPIALNGLGLTAAACEGITANLESTFSLIEEVPAIFAAWKRLVQSSGVLGKQVHDARLVAICHVYAVPNLLTFNTQHFVRLSSIGPGLLAIHPCTV